MSSGRRAANIEAIIRDWLDEPELLVFSGNWSNGAVMELVPSAGVLLTPPRYVGEFAGLRDLVLDAEMHHVHLDLGQLTHATYLVTSSVCFGFRPSFELRLHRDGEDPAASFGLGFGMRLPYCRGKLARPAVGRYLGRLHRHCTDFPEEASVLVVDPPRDAPEMCAEAWGELAGLWMTGGGPPVLENLRR